MILTGKSSFSGTHYWRAWKAGQVYNGSAYEDYLLANYATYDIEAGDKGLGNFTGSIPADADFAELVYQAGGSPAATDSVVWVYEIANIGKVAGQTATATGAVDFDDLGNASLGDATAANQTLILAQVNKITTGRTQYISHVHETDVTVNQGETYSATLNPLTFTFAGGDSWPTDLTSYTITLIARQTHDTQGNTPTSPASISQAGSVATATGDSRAVRIDFTAAQSAALTPGLYEYYLKASTGSGGSTVDWLRQGQLRVVDATP